ncbi:hypothetical protein FDP41_009650 [Naegleria fowleri]|uniref:Uncharacterized protein n=1 Tax=Naegleria fowleri TaxID=5763 RepID=A0A6A5BCZ7_NAEFO|nr:uncharacterized protein FDP41_009650 [Naegleria fowleri]KAF0971954.1 hypothetical protein FDP41_009650 [Naegleria fowleri]
MQRRSTIFKVVISTLLITSLVLSTLCSGQFFGGYGGFPYGTGGLGGVSGPFFGTGGLGGNPFGGYGGVINSLPYLPSSGNSFGYPGYGGMGGAIGPYSTYGSGNNPYGYSSGYNPYTASYNSNGAGNNQQRLRFSGQIYGFNPFYHGANLVSVDLEYVGNCARLLSGGGSNTGGGGGSGNNFNPLFDPINGVNPNALFGGGSSQQQSKQAGQDQQSKLESFASYFANQTRLHAGELGAHASAYGPPGANDLASSIVDAADRLSTAALGKKWSDYAQAYQSLDNSLSRISYLALSQQVPSGPFGSFGQQGQQQGSGAQQQGPPFQIPPPPQFQVPQFGPQQGGAAQQQGSSSSSGPMNGAFNIPNIPNLQQPPTFNIPNIPNVPNPAQGFFGQQGQQQQQGGQQQGSGATQPQGASQQQGGNAQQQQGGQQTQQQSQHTQQTQPPQQQTSVTANQTQTAQK